ncbi:MAG: hypothetical protein GY793_06385 [Proteobacteria bacterium]|nr:hypothetical protein [Pseudomonadota bacterium]
MKKYNLDKLVKVTVNDFYRSKWYKFVKGKQAKYFWQDNYKEGFYIDCIGLSFIGTKPLKGHIFKDGVVFEKPYVTMYLQGGVETRKYFDTLKQAQDFASDITIGKNWLLN